MPFWIDRLNSRRVIYIDNRRYSRSGFFSSRRRHTRWTGDWSSVVCSSDLFPDLVPELSGSPEMVVSKEGVVRAREEIGRASCRERVEISVVGVSLKKKK